MTIWSVFPDTTKYFMASPSSFMANYIVDDLDALLDRLAKAGARIDPKRRGESYGCFAWIYDHDGNRTVAAGLARQIVAKASGPTAPLPSQGMQV